MQLEDLENQKILHKDEILRNHKFSSKKSLRQGEFKTCSLFYGTPLFNDYNYMRKISSPQNM